MRDSMSATGSVNLILISPQVARLLLPLYAGRRTRGDVVCTSRQVAARPFMRPRARILPGRLRNAWNFTTQRQTAETQATYPELAEISARASADLAAVVFARRKFRLACVLYSLCCR